MEVQFNRYAIIRPHKGRSFIKLPKVVELRKATCTLRKARFYNLHIHDHGLNFSRVSYPTTLKDIKKFQVDNNVDINVFALDKKNNVYLLQHKEEVWHDTEFVEIVEESEE